MVTYSNPRLSAHFEDWPSGGERVQCRFDVETDPKKGQRVARTTTDRHGRWCKPKKTTYAHRCAIVDGDDGRTYILQESRDYRMVCVMQHNLQFQAESAGESCDPERYAELCELVANAQDKVTA